MYKSNSVHVIGAPVYCVVSHVLFTCLWLPQGATCEQKVLGWTSALAGPRTAGRKPDKADASQPDDLFHTK